MAGLRSASPRSSYASEPPAGFRCSKRQIRKRGKPATAAHKAQWAVELALGPIFQWKDGLNAYVESYTKGDTKTTGDACGDARALDAGVICPTRDAPSAWRMQICC